MDLAGIQGAYRTLRPTDNRDRPYHSETTKIQFATCSSSHRGNPAMHLSMVLQHIHRVCIPHRPAATGALFRLLSLYNLSPQNLLLTSSAARRRESEACRLGEPITAPSQLPGSASWTALSRLVVCCCCFHFTPRSGWEAEPKRDPTEGLASHLITCSFT